MAASTHDRWLLILAKKKKQWPCWFWPLFPCFFLFSSLLFPSLSIFLSFSFLSLFIVTNKNSFCSLCFIFTPSVLFSFFLCCSLFSFFYFLPLHGDDEGDGNESVLCWLSSSPCLCVFFFQQCSSALFFSFRSSPFCPLSLCFFSIPLFSQAY